MFISYRIYFKLSLSVHKKTIQQWIYFKDIYVIEVNIIYF